MQPAFLYFVHATYMNSAIRKKLERIFFGKIPDYLPVSDDDATAEAFKRQDIIYEPDKRFPDVFSMNFATFIQDLAEIEREKGIDNSPPADIDLDEYRHNVRVMMRGLYEEFIARREKDEWEKLSMTFYLRNILMYYVRVHGYEAMEDQLPFIIDLYGMEDYYIEIIKQQQAPFLAWEQEQLLAERNHKFELASNWPADIIKLDLLCEDLHDDGFIENAASFKQVFDSNSNGVCNWLKPRTTLIYLLWMLLDKGSDKPSPGTLHLVCNRFAVKGQPTTPKIAQSTNIKPYIDTPKSKLTGLYARLHTICRSIKFQ